jgi:thioredoxin reductase (NADPH)
MIKEETVISVDLKTPRNYLVKTNKQTYVTKSIILATGAVAKRLKFEGSDTFWMKGISACAVCDGALPMFRNKVLAVIGGGDTACEEASFLSKFGSSVLIIVRKDRMRASKIMQERVLNNPKIRLLYESEVISAHTSKDSPDQNLGFIRVFNSKSQETVEIEVSGLFFAIGHKPASDFLEGQVATNTEGYIITNPNSTQTSVEGIFAAGDVQDYKWRQAITAAGSGCMAALECEHYLQSII